MWLGVYPFKTIKKCMVCEFKEIDEKFKEVLNSFQTDQRSCMDF